MVFLYLGEYGAAGRDPGAERTDAAGFTTLVPCSMTMSFTSYIVKSAARQCQTFYMTYESRKI